MLIFCAAVGLAIGTRPAGDDAARRGTLGFYPLDLDWHYALLAGASVALIIGLIRQAVQMSKLDLRGTGVGPELSFARSYAVAWRFAIAGVLIFSIVAALSISRQIVRLPETETRFTYALFPYVLWICAILVVLMSSVSHWRRCNEVQPASRSRNLIGWVIGALLALLILPDVGLITYLVHIATGNIESAQPFVYQRPAEFPDHSKEGFRLFWITIAASGGAVFAAASAAFMIQTQRRMPRALGLFVFVATLSTVAAYCIWYYTREFERVSPYLAGAGIGGNWIELATGAVITFIFVTAGANRIASSGRPNAATADARIQAGELPAIHESFICLVALLCATAIYVGETVRVYVSVLLGFSTSTARVLRSRAPVQILETLASLCRDPCSILVLAIGMLCLELIWLRWRRRSASVDLTLTAADPRRFAWSWGALALLAIVGLPTISIFCYVVWLGPWYLYAE